MAKLKESKFKLGQPVFVYPNFEKPYRVDEVSAYGAFYWISSADGVAYYVHEKSLEPLKLRKETMKRCLRLISFNPEFPAQLNTSKKGV